MISTPKPDVYAWMASMNIASPAARTTWLSSRVTSTPGSLG